MRATSLLLGIIFGGLLPSALGATDGGVRNNPAYAQWLRQRPDSKRSVRGPTSYSNSKDLPCPGHQEGEVCLILYWDIDPAKQKIRIAVAIESKGWVALGFTEMGGMPGADMLIFERSRTRLLDAHAVAYERPNIDERQDWTLLNSVTNKDVIIFEAERALDTGDPMDWPFEDDSNIFKIGTKIIAAWGDTAEMHHHGPKNRLQGEVRFHAGADSVSDKEVFDKTMEEEGEGHVSLFMDQFTVPHRYTTWYAWKCLTVADFVKEQGLPGDKPVHLIGFEVDPDPGDLLHHIVVYYDTSENFSKCDPYHSATSMMMIWNTGQSKTYAFPNNIGVLLADESDRAGAGLGVRPKSFRLEIHYENPHKYQGSKDSSGVRLHYTTKLREITAGTLELADPQVKMTGKPVGAGLRQHTFGCPKSCTQSHLPQQGVTVFYQVLHMHKKGQVMEIAHQRNGEDLNTARVQYFDFKFGAKVVEHEFTVLPGDTFQSRCTYESNESDKIEFGHQARAEMCLGTIYYYPASTSAHMMCTMKSNVKQCVSTHSAMSLARSSSLNRTFGLLEDSSKAASGKSVAERQSMLSKKQTMTGNRRKDGKGVTRTSKAATIRKIDNANEKNADDNPKVSNGDSVAERQSILSKKQTKTEDWRKDGEGVTRTSQAVTIPKITNKNDTGDNLKVANGISIAERQSMLSKKQITTKDGRKGGTENTRTSQAALFPELYAANERDTPSLTPKQFLKAAFLCIAVVLSWKCWHQRNAIPGISRTERGKYAAAHSSCITAQDEASAENCTLSLKSYWTERNTQHARFRAKTQHVGLRK